MPLLQGESLRPPARVDAGAFEHIYDPLAIKLHAGCEGILELFAFLTEAGAHDPKEPGIISMGRVRIMQVNS